jgi:A/G-specific adenine glycosylase
VKRVFARHFAVDGYPGVAAVERQLWSIAEQELPATGIESYTQGLMDLGATLCARVRPRCGDCPVAVTCIARAQGRIADLPAPRPAKARPVRHAIVVIVRDDRGALLLETRPPTGIWGGLVSLPEFDAEADDQQLTSAIAERYALQVDLNERLPELRHEFSHYCLVMHPRVAAVRRALGAAASASQWLQPDALQDAALPAPVKRLLRKRYGEA